MILLSKALITTAGISITTAYYLFQKEHYWRPIYDNIQTIESFNLDYIKDCSAFP